MLYRFLQFLKEAIFPIEKSELKLFCKFAALLICVLFNFSSLRTLKDSLVISSIGAEAISFLKLWLVLPCAIVFTFLYVRLSNSFNLQQIFTLFVAIFISFFVVFAFIIYPYQHKYHTPSKVIEALIVLWPHCKWFIKLFGKWSYVMLYVLAEIWGAMIINLMFWQFANHIFKKQQAQRLYPMIGMFGSLGLIFAGKLLTIFAQIENLSIGRLYLYGQNYDQMELAIKLIVFSVSIVGVIAILIFRNIYAHYVDHDGKNVPLIKDTKTSLGLWQSIKMIYHSKYIFYIFVLVISYGLTINILEGPWKAKLSQLYLDPCEYIQFMGKFNVWMGISSIVMTIIGGNILRRLGWKFAAYITPVMIAITGTLFFAFVVFGEKIHPLGFDPIYAAVMVGAIQNIASKSSKYSIFDSTKEMTYIPLPLELRTKGKAAVEIIGAKLGKSLGAFLQFVGFTIIPDLDFNRISIFLMIVFIAVALVWLIDVNKLSKEYQKLDNAQNS
jgi:AAA family ATP:ADP antiporter